MLGHAGRAGFKGSNIHTINTPFAACAICPNEEKRNNLHNISLDEFAHSDYFLSSGHARFMWLPILWGYTPENYKIFLELCSEAMMHETHREFEKLDISVYSLLNLELELGPDGGSQKLKNYIKRQIAIYAERKRIDLVLDDKKGTVALVLRGIWHAVNEALKDPISKKYAINLWPPAAAQKSIRALFRAKRNGGTRTVN